MELPITRTVYDTLNLIKNNNIMRKVYTFQDKTRSVNYKQRLSYHLHKISREFIYNISQDFSNLHGCGLFTYVALLCNACSNFNKKNKTVYAWVKGKEKYFSKILNLKNKKELYRQLDILKELGLINYRIKDEEIIVFILCGTVDVDESVSRKKIIAQYAAIKTHNGYVFVNEVNLIELLQLEAFYSEADIMVDLWLNTIFNDPNIEISKTPLVYLDSNREDLSSNINVTTNQLSKRWNCSYGRVNKILKRARDLDYISFYIIPNIGTVIFNKAYIKYFAKQNKYKEDGLSLYRCFYGTKALIKYIVYIYKAQLNCGFKKTFLLKLIGLFKRVKINPYKFMGGLKRTPFIYRVFNLLSLFDFKKRCENSHIQRVLSGFLKRCAGNYIV